ncbi:hypothetical protein [Desulforegula conservatrix]|uniref:hypothetical protein n=1 Tax=Desulforegula conservatrix TaxID=153026 RepID=UPI000425B8F1|nr:hypothetical protein [Desulforegula conservatrix]
MTESNKNEKFDKANAVEKVGDQMPSGIEDISRVFVEQQSNIINEVNDSIHTDSSKNK